MAAKTNEYRRLPGRGRKNAVMGGLVTLWVAKDHLLQVEGNRYSEDYRRFYFADIQAIILRRTKRWEITNWTLGALLLITVALHLWGLSKNPSEADAIAIWIFAGIFEVAFTIPLIFSLIGGPTCICQIQTAVQRENLASLGKLRKARKALEQIREVVTAVQGEPPPDLAAPQPSIRRSSPVIPSVTTAAAIEADPPTNLKIVSLLLSLVSILAGVMALLKEIAVWDYVAQGVLTTAQFILVIVILVKKADKAAWIKVILLGIWIFVFGTAASLISQGDLVASQWNPIAQSLLGWGTIGLFGFLSIVEGVSLVLSRDQPLPPTPPPVASIPPPLPRSAFKDFE